MQDFFTTTLSGNVALSDTVINLTNVPSATEGYLVIDPNNPTTREIIYYNSKTSSTVTCPDATANSSRGLGGTSVQTHLSGVAVELREVAEYWQALQNGQSLGTGAALANLAAKSITNGYLANGLVANRQGGTTGAASWATAGTSNTDVSATAVMLQTGSVLANGSTTVTFPTAYNQVPLVFVSIITATSVNAWARVAGISATNFVVEGFTNTSTASTTENVSWLAIGQ
jgi:hypothetical protein